MKKLFYLIFLFAAMVMTFGILGNVMLSGRHSFAVAYLDGWGFAMSFLGLLTTTVAAIAYPHTDRGMKP